MSGQQRLSDLMPRPLTTRSKPWLALATYGSIGVGFATLVTRTCLKHPLFPFQASLSLALALALSLAPALTLTLRRKAPVCVAVHLRLHLTRRTRPRGHSLG